LTQRWLAQGLTLGEGVSAAEVTEFEARHGIDFATDVREYLLALNGLCDIDNDCCRLFSLKELRRVRDLFAAIGGGFSTSPLLNQDVADFFVFGDYDCAIAFWAVSPGLQSEVVVIGGSRDARRVTKTLDEFLSIYASKGPEALIGSTRRG
jgi:hypothetical protein